MSNRAFTKSFLDSPTGAKLRLYTFLAKGKNTRGVVQINHGMSEHGARYERFAKFLSGKGYHTVVHDHRGHGETIAYGAPLGIFAPKDGWQKVIADIHSVNTHARKTWPGKPVILFGHSMGSIVGLGYCINHSDTVDAAALWNSGVDAGALLSLFSFLLNMERMFKGSDVPSAIAQKLTFDAFNAKFKPNRTGFDWLSRDEKEVDKYVADPLCGFPASNSLWQDLLDGIHLGADDRQLAKIRKDLPVNLLGGGKDPCSMNGTAMQRLAGRMEKSGISDVECRILAETRHESLNEINRDDTMQEFAAWLDERLARKKK